MNVRRSLLLVLPLLAAGVLSAGEPKAPPPKPVGPKRIPPPGVEVPAADRTEMEASVKTLGEAIEKLRVDLQGKPKLLDLLPDVQIYHKAVDVALRHNEILDAKEIPVAKNLLKHGHERAAALAKGEAPWTTATGLVPRGYVSKIDGSIQPYGLVIPADFKPEDAPRRLDFWFHGRDEKLTELKFVNDREKGAGEFVPPGAFVMHLYGRFCNANHFAGEVDLFEALEHAKARYPIDEKRLVVRGFSMGGAACWHFATHHAGLWAAAAPGAGFSETARFSKIDPATVPWYEKKLWHIYDATDYAVNLFNVPTVAYSGENDRQKQAADVMIEALKAEGLEIPHIIGPKTEHKYHPDSKPEINKLVDAAVAKGRDDAPKKVRFTTFTLRYNTMKWVTVDGLEKHWDRARVEADLAEGVVNAKTENVNALTLSFAKGTSPFADGAKVKVTIDGTAIDAPAPAADKSWVAHFRKNAGAWALVDKVDDGSLRKRHGLQGPIDDAFMESFVVVKPTGKPLNEAVGKWVDSELERSLEHWRRIFRGDARVIPDSIGDAEIAAANLVLWGDPSSNKVLAQIADKLPIKWTAAGVQVGGKTYPADQYVPTLIYPNPLNPKKYVVINSGFTFMKHSSGSNARHIAILPDWTIVNVIKPKDEGVEDAAFFGEQWELTDKRE